MKKILNIGVLVLDPRLQMRTEIVEETVADYAEDILDGDVFPPVTAFFDGIHYYLADGYHRYHAHKRAEKASIDCEVVNGTIRDAILFAVSVNSKHGMRRTWGDKRKSVMTLLEDFLWNQWSNAEIARHCDVSAPFVANLRNLMDKPQGDTVKYKTASGEVKEKAKAPGRKAEPKEPELKGPEIKPEEPEQDERQEAIDMMLSENEELKARLAVAAMEGTEEEKAMAAQTISELREEVRLLKIENTSLKISRDGFQAENAQLKRQVQMMTRKLKQQEA